MPVYKLVLKCDLDGLDTLTPDPTSCFSVKLRCNSCRTDADTLVVLDPSEAPVEVKGSKGTCSVAWKCKFCSRDGNLTLQPLQKIECRGSAEIIGWDPAMSTWTGVTPEGTTFAVDLSQGDWTDYDQEGGHPVDVSNIQGIVTSG